MSFRSFLGSLALAFLAAVPAAAPAAAHEVKAGDLVLTDLWSRATPPGAPAAGFLSIANAGAAPDRLIAVASPAGAASLHESATENGVATMRPVEALEIPAGGSVTLAPGGYHIMIEGLAEPLAEGSDLPISLTFEHAGTVETFLHVYAIGAAGPNGEAGGGMEEMDHMDHMSHGAGQ